jgi:hypothetical protein
MSTAKFSHTATLLSSGKVLIAGGETSVLTYDRGYSDSDLARAELYDPVAGTFTATDSMTTARAGHTATLLGSGQVLVVGGNGVSGGTLTLLASAELYDPTVGTFAATGSLTVARYNHTATLLTNGMALIAGGLDVVALASAELYDPSAGTFTATGSMVAGRDSHTATLLGNGEVLIAGGNGNAASSTSSSGYVLASAELYE